MLSHLASRIRNIRNRKKKKTYVTTSGETKSIHNFWKKKIYLSEIDIHL